MVVITVSGFTLRKSQVRITRFKKHLFIKEDAVSSLSRCTELSFTLCLE